MLTFGIKGIFFNLLNLSQWKLQVITVTWEYCPQQDHYPVVFWLVQVRSIPSISSLFYKAIPGCSAFLKFLLMGKKDTEEQLKRTKEPKPNFSISFPKVHPLYQSTASWKQCAHKGPLQSVIKNFINKLLVQSANEPKLVCYPHHKRDPALSCEPLSRQWATHHLPAAQHTRSSGQATGLPKSPPKIPLSTFHHHHTVPSPQPQLPSAPEHGLLFLQSLCLREQHTAWAALTQGTVTLGTGRKRTFLLALSTSNAIALELNCTSLCNIRLSSLEGLSLSLHSAQQLTLSKPVDPSWIASGSRMTMLSSLPT